MPGVAPAAMQMGRHAARNIARALRGEPPAAVPLPRQGLARHHRPQRRRSPSSGGCTSRASLAWLAWLAVHIFFLIGFRNRLVVMIDWAWAYLTYQRSARLIFGRTTTTESEPGP